MMVTGSPATQHKEHHMDRITERAAERIVADLATQGGGTYEGRTLLPFEPKSGYAVGIGGATIPAEAASPFSIAFVAKAVAGEYMTDFVGTWLDKGIVYIDAVRYFADDRRAAAEALGRECGQQAIYDFGNDETIDLGDEDGEYPLVQA